VFSTTIYSATDFAVFPVDRRSTTQLLGSADEAYLLGLVKAHLYSAPFYFTYGGYNVCSRLQAQAAPGEKQKPFWQQASRPSPKLAPRVASWLGGGLTVWVWGWALRRRTTGSSGTGTCSRGSQMRQTER